MGWLTGSLPVDVMEGDKAAVGGFEFGVLAAFLFDQIIFHAADRFGGGEDFLPRRGAFAEQALCSLSPATNLLDAASGCGPGFLSIQATGSHAGFEASADVELQHHAFVGVSLARISMGFWPSMGCHSRS